MDLDDLRRQWQQAPPPPSTPPVGLTDVIGRAPGSSIDRMRRNTWHEITVALLTVVSSGGLLLLHPGPLGLLYAMLLGLLVLIMSGYYVLQINLLKQLARTDSNVRGHLGQVCAGLRRLLRFNDTLTLWTGPVTLLILLGYYVGRELGRPAAPRWSKLGLALGAGLVLGAGLQFGLLKLNRWWSQYRYGQHLDRLESQLRELDDSSPLAPA